MDLRNIEITQDIAAKVLAVIDAGLVNGVGEPEPGKMCVEAAVCYALGLPHGDDPQCVSRAVRSLKIRLNDQPWSSPLARAKGLRRLGIAQLGSRDVTDDKEFAKRVAALAIRKSVPKALRAAASIQKNAEHRQKLLDAANKCEAEGSEQSARDARLTADAADAAYAAYAAAYAADAAYAAYADAAAYTAAADAAADAAAAYAAYADAAAYTAAADAAADADAADAAAAAAYTAAAADAAAARDKSLAEFAEDVVQILIDMNAPGCKFLNLTEVAA